MKKISDVITEELFVNAYKICKKYSEKEFITDVNLMLLKNAFQSVTENNIRTYYHKYIKSEIFYAIPCLFSADTVSIPKNVNGLREYKFFSMMSMILYNAVGLLFVDVCNDFLLKVKFESKSIYHFSPTKFSNDGSEWKSQNEYAKQYTKFTEKIEEIVEEGNIVLKIDISNYFDSMKHEKLVNLLKELGLESKLAIYDIDEKARDTLLFYFESLMNKKQGIPQGKVNCVSDLYGLLYMLPLDFNIIDLCNNCNLEYKAMIRYVDDTMIIFKNKNNLENHEIFKELSKLEQKLSLFLNNELMLRINEKKTEYAIIHSEEVRKKFIEDNTKKVSNASNMKKEIQKDQEIENKINEMLNVVEKYKFTDDDSFEFKITDKEKEKLKIVFDKNIKEYLKKPEIKDKIRKILSKLDIELTVNQMNILIALFFIEDKNTKPYLDILVEYILKNLDLKDKRLLHIILLMISQGIDFKDYDKFNIYINQNQKDLFEDNYGKYILILKKIIKNDENVNILGSEGIFNQLNYEFNKNSKYTRKILSENNTMYNKLILKVIEQENINESIINQLKWYVYNIRNENLDSAFNHFHNVFHEICKEKLKLSDQDSVEKIISKLYKNNFIGNKEEVLIRKFYDRRNFNPVSHPSKNGKASVKISKEILEEFEDGIIDILLKLLEKNMV
mgnify:FL=1